MTVPVCDCSIGMQTLFEPGLGGLHPRAVTLARVCTTCEIVRPLRAKHDAITGWVKGQ